MRFYIITIKHGKSEVKDCIDWIREELYELVDKTESVKELLAYLIIQ